ncbi:hypothetical protein [Micromonospora wenchangensis]|uniref:hypothetical protein n=1 Tax=Micromonospora wenchangensis TaxID=1185415 RepID=UPI003D733181
MSGRAGVGPTTGVLAAQWSAGGQAHKQPTVSIQPDALLDRKVLLPHIIHVIPVNPDRHSCEVMTGSVTARDEAQDVPVVGRIDHPQGPPESLFTLSHIV